MQTTSTPQQGERINLLAAGLITAVGGHLLLNLLGLPKLFTLPAPGFMAILVAALKVFWTLAGLGAGAYVIYNASFMVNARSYTKAKIAARGALVLPLFGLAGAITGFALVPVGALAMLLLRQPHWMAAFDDVEIVYENSEEESATESEPVTPPVERP